MLVGTASTGAFTSPATTVGSAPSIPAHTISTRADCSDCLLRQQTMNSGDAHIGITSWCFPSGASSQRLLRRRANRWSRRTPAPDSPSAGGSLSLLEGDGASHFMIRRARLNSGTASKHSPDARVASTLPPALAMWSKSAPPGRRSSRRRRSPPACRCAARDDDRAWRSRGLRKAGP